MAESKSITVVEAEHANEMRSDLHRRMVESQKREYVRMDSVRASVLSYVVDENYEAAKSELETSVHAKTDYPVFQTRVEKYVKHCCDLIEAIHMKRNFPGLASLSLSKQQELHERVLGHFEELKQNLKHIEMVERDQKVSDVRSTVLVLQAISAVAVAILCTAIYTELHHGMLMGATQHALLLMDELSGWVVNHIPYLTAF